MLELKNIYKDYPAGSGTVHALKGVDLQFRQSEFVSILGSSGCGKTRNADRIIPVPDKVAALIHERRQHIESLLNKSIDDYGYIAF